ncbi:MAG: VWA domain-containing protein [Actinobacteria bacterium]|nr:VWA domain-containing protein [Actinomycetota bacterium]
MAPSPEITDHPAHIWFLLDRSGSMSSLYQDVVLGLQEFVREQRIADPRARMTLVQFDSEDTHDVILDGMTLSEVDEARATKRFEPRAATPLYDAIAALIGRADKHIANGGDDADQLVVIFTDGMENASTDCNRAKAFELIKERRGRGWAFAFLGANQDAFEAGEAIGIAPANRMGWEATGPGARATLGFASRKSAEQLRRTRSERREKRDDFLEDD